MRLIVRSRYGEFAEMVAEELARQLPLTEVSVNVDPTATRYALRLPADLPSTDRDVLCKALMPLQPEVDESLKPGDPLELLFGHTDALGDFRLAAKGDDYRLLRQITGRVRTLPFDWKGSSVVATDDSVLGFGCAPPFVRDAILWCAAQHGVNLDPSCSEAHGHNLFLHIRSPESERVCPRGYLPIVLRGDDPVFLRRLQTALVATGFTNTVVSPDPWDGSASGRLLFHPGPFARGGLSRELAWLGKISSDLVASVGVDVKRYPVQLDKGDWRGHATFELPVGAALSGALTTYAGPFPERIDAVVATDEPVHGDLLADGLRSCGFRTVTVVKLAEPRGFTIRWGAAQLATTQVAVRELVRAAMSSVPAVHQLHEYGGLRLDHVDALAAMAAWMDADEEEAEEGDGGENEPWLAEPLVIELPLWEAKEGKLLSLGPEHGHGFRMHIRHQGEVTDRVRELANRFRGCFGTVVIAERNGDDDGIQYGGATPVLVDHVRDVVRQVYGVELPLRRSWGERDVDVFVDLPKEQEGEEEVAPPKEVPLLRSVNRRFLRVRQRTVRVGPLVLPRRGNPTDLPVLTARCFAHHCVDSGMAATLLHVAESVLMKEPCLLEGEPGTSKTSAILMLASALGHPVLRVNLHGQTDASELVGRFAPAPGGSGLGWRWTDGVVPTAMTKGAWLLIDETNLAEPQNLERLNSVLETPPTLLVAEHDNEWFGPGGARVHPDFRVFGTMNPSTEAGRSAQSRAWMDRWVGHRTVPSPTEADLVSMLRHLLFGEGPAVEVQGVHYARGKAKPVHQRAAGLERIDLFVERVVRFHVSLNQAFRKGDEGAGPSPGGWGSRSKLFTRRSLLRLASYLDRAAGSSDATAAYRDGVERYYLRKLSSKREQRMALLMSDASGLCELTGGVQR